MAMPPRAFLTVLLLLGAAVPAAVAKELTADEFMENVSSLLDTAPEPPEVTEAQVVELEEGDPETYIFVRGAMAHPPVPVNLGGDGRLSLLRADSRESLTAAYRRKDGSYDAAELARINRLLRCSRTGKEADISVKLLEILDAVEDGSGARHLTVLSAYRTPRFNRSLRGAARWSLHMLGWAADIRVPGRTPAEVADFAVRLAQGGVGHYADAGFVHLDAGRRRSWTVRAKPRPAVKKKPSK